ncbi:hypothetical protein BCR44DRAFT_1459869 [Catenaria anguillulae PL171]|uniref:C3H1-type domain-containing protein n=1 Tax=Catenaria anguillulae PL171 TaxID=765915 RepID=A0A1Y2HW01_9FUNG|nr:hypothetical protein BCR44DRAFT_1459869 [Catenaria anguillulae PL171]
MADYLASIYGTEKDKVNCSFYFKIGSCRHGDRCSRKHIKPTFSPTILIRNVYKNPSHDPACTLTAQQLQDHFDRFYEDWYTELATAGGPLEEMHVCDNVGEHLIGNVYARFRNEADAAKLVDLLNSRYYDAWPLYAELCPVTDFREACCRQHETGQCNRGGFCNFMHLRHPTPALRMELHEAQKAMIIARGGLEGLGRGAGGGVGSGRGSRPSTATAAGEERERDRDRDRERSGRSTHRDRDREAYDSAAGGDEVRRRERDGGDRDRDYRRSRDYERSSRSSTGAPSGAADVERDVRVREVEHVESSRRER